MGKFGKKYDKSSRKTEAQVTYEEKHEDHNEIAKPVTD